MSAPRGAAVDRWERSNSSASGCGLVLAVFAAVALVAFRGRFWEYLIVAMVLGVAWLFAKWGRREVLVERKTRTATETRWLLLGKRTRQIPFQSLKGIELTRRTVRFPKRDLVYDVVLLVQEGPSLPAAVAYSETHAREEAAILADLTGAPIVDRMARSD